MWLEERTQARTKALGQAVSFHRELMGLSQEALTSKFDLENRSIVAHLEQGRRLPRDPQTLEAICTELKIDERLWHYFIYDDSRRRGEFEDCLSELVGEAIDLGNYSRDIEILTVERKIKALFPAPNNNVQAFDLYNSILIYYGVLPVSQAFYKRFLGSEVFASPTTFAAAITEYHKIAIRLFSTLTEAYREMNSTDDLSQLLEALSRRSLEPYTLRSEWDHIEEISEERLPDLGYISATRVKQEEKERQILKTTLEELAKDIREHGPKAIEGRNERTRRRIDSLLRKFESRITHGLFSPLFVPDPDDLEREAARLAPKSEEDMARMEETQARALRNLSRYLTADHMDLYVATSMRTDADFVSVNRFVQALFRVKEIEDLNLRYFNPTQSWIEDRIAKGLVEALMLRRADITIYLAQKSDSFGKDSEASVALGQGKPVIVYVPKLTLEDEYGTDMELIGRQKRQDLIALVREEGEPDDTEIDDAIDDESLLGRILLGRLEKATDRQITGAVARHWADFDLHSEAERLKDGENTSAIEKRKIYRAWLDHVVEGREEIPIPVEIKSDLVGILVAVALQFERRAKLFREIHPLALQVILSSGVLNGILVVRSVEQCAKILKALLENNLELDYRHDHMNYKLVERITDSTVRVISRHRLLRNAFEAFYAASRVN